MPPSTRRSDDSMIGPSRERTFALVAHGLIEQQRIGDAIAREGIDDDALLVGRRHLLRRGIEIEDALVEVVDRLHHRDLPVRVPGSVMILTGTCRTRARSPARS